MRAEGRRIQAVVGQLQQIYLHRGSQLSRIGVALLTALSTPCPVAAVQAPQLRRCIVPPPPPPPLLQTVVPAVQLNPDAPAFVPKAPQRIQPSSGSLDESGPVAAAVASSSASDAPCNHGGSFESVPATSPNTNSDGSNNDNDNNYAKFLRMMVNAPPPPPPQGQPEFTRL